MDVLFGAVVHIVDAFTAAYLRLCPSAVAERVRTVPQLLCRALVAILPVDAATISLLGDSGTDLPMLIGASNADAERAARIEFTCGQGPGMTAHSTGRTVAMSADFLAAAWPLYSDPLWATTSLRSAVAAPLPGALQQTATLTLLFHSSCPPAIAEPDLAALGDRITNSLLDTSDQPPHLAQDDRPSWLDGPTLHIHHRIMVAAGIISARWSVTIDDGLAMLRAHAWAQGCTADQLADDIIEDTSSTRTAPEQRFTW